MIQLKNVIKEYQAGDSRIEALKGISIAFRPCEFVSILGPSGGGKTTLLNIIGGLDHYTSGDLLINGTSTKDFGDRQWDSYRSHTVGFVFQTYNLIPHQSVQANVELAMTLSGVSRAQRRAKAREALQAVGLGDQLSKKPNQLSGGQMQRVAIARALVNDPDVVLADEPTGALDSATSVQVMDILKEVSARRLVIMVTHNPELAEKYSTRIVKLLDGRIVGDSSPYDEPEAADAKAEQRKLANKPSMGLLTAFGLSLNNLLTKRGRTILTALAGSIGIIGIALIMALSTGVNKYIEDVQVKTLSSYPLMINTSSIDLTTMMTSTMTTMSSSDDTSTTPGMLTEKKVIGDMFATVGTNDLKDFKQYLEDNASAVSADANAVQYGYDPVPQIYKYDTADGAVRLNPSTAFSSIQALMGSSQYSYSSLYQQMVDNQDLLDSQYKVVAGHWPQAYDQVVLVLNKEGVIGDLVEYMVGLRDQNELKEMMKVAQNGGTYEVPDADHALTYTYDQILAMKFKMVMSSDYYRYNAEYGVWEDMTDDAAYLKKLVDGGLTLKVVGIVCPSSSTAMSSLTSGIAYTKALTDYMISQASASAIVKQQLSDEKTNVFNGLDFTATDGTQNAKDYIDLSQLYSVDKDKMAAAFGSKVSASDIQTLVSQYVSKTIGTISVDTAPAQTALEGLFTNALTGLVDDMLAGQPAVTLDASAFAAQAAAYMAGTAVQSQITALAAAYGVPATAIGPSLTALLDGHGTGLLKACYAAVYDAGSGQAILPAAMADTMVSSYLSSAAVKAQLDAVLPSMAQALTEAKIKTAVGTSMGSMAADLSTTIAGGMTFDAQKFKDAISINMDEDTLTRVITSYVNSGSDNASCTGNLTKLGYADASRPTSIKIYLKDFNGKTDFLKLVESYNERMKAAGTSEKAITYTDIAGSIIASVKTIVDVISYVLIAFVAISLVVSSIMIGIITYISVLERTKEIGLLRAMGASKGDVSNVFNAETFIEGLVAGLLGVAISVLLCLPITALVRHLTNIDSLTAYLPLGNAALLVAVSVVMTLIAGLIPSRMAAKKDPVTALRSE